MQNLSEITIIDENITPSAQDDIFNRQLNKLAEVVSYLKQVGVISSENIETIKDNINKYNAYILEFGDNEPNDEQKEKIEQVVNDFDVETIIQAVESHENENFDEDDEYPHEQFAESITRIKELTDLFRSYPERMQPDAQSEVINVINEYADILERLTKSDIYSLSDTQQQTLQSVSLTQFEFKMPKFFTEEEKERLASESTPNSDLTYISSTESTPLNGIALTLSPEAKQLFPDWELSFSPHSPKRKLQDTLPTSINLTGIFDDEIVHSNHSQPITIPVPVEQHLNLTGNDTTQHSTPSTPNTISANLFIQVLCDAKTIAAFAILLLVGTLALLLSAYAAVGATVATGLIIAGATSAGLGGTGLFTSGITHCLFAPPKQHDGINPPLNQNTPLSANI